jgi:mRNA-degrading endonuclease RelE of RelBE toxin-antitoxin system
MTDVEYTHTAEKFFSKLKGNNKKYIKKIMDKVDYCLEKHLFNYDPQCNKKAIKGSKTGSHRLHIERQYTLIYTIVGEKPDRHAKINEILTYEKAHQIYGLL